MSLQYLDISTVSPYLAKAWEKYLNTDKDPANGRWYTNGPDNDNMGLYGGLSDAYPQLSFDAAKGNVQHTRIVAASGEVDNRKGLTPEASLTLSYSYSDAATTSHTITNSVSAGAEVDLEGSAELLGVGGKATAKFTVNYTFSYASTSSTTDTEEQVFSETLPITVPAGKNYKGVLLAKVQQIQVPFTANIVVSGNTETWFEDRVQGHYNWVQDIGTVFGWINQYGIAGGESSYYTNLGDGRGSLSVPGTLTAQNTADFHAEIYDVTDAGKQATDRSGAVLPEGQSPVPGGKLVKTFKF